MKQSFENQMWGSGRIGRAQKGRFQSRKGDLVSGGLRPQAGLIRGCEHVSSLAKADLKMRWKRGLTPKRSSGKRGKEPKT